MSQSDGREQWSNGVVLSFDFRVEDLKTYYSEKNPQNAYREIKEFLVKNGFEHLKDSDYKNPRIDDVETADFLYDFASENKWFPFCVQKMDISPNVIKLDISHDLQAVRDEEWVKEHLEKAAKVADENENQNGQGRGAMAD